MTINILSILLSIAMMLSGAAGLETEAVMANTLTIRDVYFSYNDESFELEPTLTAGVMTENGTAVIDLSMAAGEESLFPLQLIISEDAATLVVEKTGQAFAIDAETLNAIAAEALDFDGMAADEDFSTVVGIFKSYGDLLKNASSMQYNTEAMLLLDAQLKERFTPVETAEAVDSYNDTEYPVTMSRYELNNDQVFEMMDAVMNANEAMSAFYAQYFDLLNTTMAQTGEEMPEITGFKDLYAMIGAEMTMDITAYESEDGKFSHAQCVYTVTIQELAEPVVANMDIYMVDGIMDMMVETELSVEGMNMYVGGISYIEEGNTYYEAIMDLMPEESEDLTDEDYETAMSFFMTGGETANEAGGSDMGFTMEVTTYDGGFAFLIEGSSDADGNSTADISFDFAAEDTNITAGFSMDLSKAVFANASEGLSPIAVTPENIEVVEAEFGKAAESLMVDLQTLIENESITDMIAGFTAINTAVDAEITTVYPDKVATEEYVVEEAANTELTFNEPEFTYIPEGMTIEDLEVDAEFNSVSCTITDPNYNNTFYVYVYGDIYSSGVDSYVLGADGALTAIEEPVVNVQYEEDAIYAEMTDGEVVVSVSYYGSDLGLEDVAKVLSGMTY